MLSHWRWWGCGLVFLLQFNGTECRILEQYSFFFFPFRNLKDVVLGWSAAQRQSRCLAPDAAGLNSQYYENKQTDS